MNKLSFITSIFILATSFLADEAFAGGIVSTINTQTSQMTIHSTGNVKINLNAIKNLVAGSYTAG